MINIKKLILALLLIYSNNLDAYISSKLDKQTEETNFQKLASDTEIKNLDNKHQRNYTDFSSKQLINSNADTFIQSNDSVSIYKNLAILNAELKNSEEAFYFAKKYINNSLDFSILLNDSFKKIKNYNEYNTLRNKYLEKIDIYSFLYSSIAFIGLFLVVILNLKQVNDKLANILISSFVLINVLFLIEFIFFTTNIRYRFPHLYLFSSCLGLLYGPSLYFYFKRVSQGGYNFVKFDVLHFLPTVFLIIFILIPIYILDKNEKIEMMIGINTTFQHSSLYIFLLNIACLFFYGFFIWKLHIKTYNLKAKTEFLHIKHRWKKNILKIYLFYMVSYVLYGISTIGLIGGPSFILYNIHAYSIIVMVIYIFYTAFMQPKLFEGELHLYRKNDENLKYVKSGLTDSLVNELSQKLNDLLIEEKLFKDNNISLEFLADQLGTNRNNTSQIINERFNMNFFELINKFRIEEAIGIFESDRFRNLHIIDVAFEVGYNNKVTFNKAFKKQTSQTPSEYLSSDLDNTQVNKR